MVWQQETRLGGTDRSALPIAGFETYLSHQLNNCTLPGELRLTQQLEILWSQYKEQYQTFAADPMRDPAVYRQDLFPRHEQLRHSAQAIADMNMNNMVSVDGKVKRTLLTVRNTLLVLVLVGTLIAAAFVGAVGAALLKPLTTLTRGARQIEQGNLDLNLDVRSRDEIGQLADAFNSMARELRQARQLDRNTIERTQQTTRLAVDSLPDAVVLVNPQGKVEIANRCAREHFGIAPDLDISARGDDWLTRLYARVRADHVLVEPDGYEGTIQVFANGNERFFLPRAVPILDAAQAVIGVTVVLVDVTHLRHIDEAKSDLISTVSHELRTPLTSLRMSVMMLAGGQFGPLTQRQAKLVQAAAEESDRLYRIIENLLSLSRMESGRTQFQFQLMSPRDIVEQAAEPMRGNGLPEKGLSLELRVEDPGRPVMADPAQIGYALTNILANALKFTPAPGTVTVQTQTDGESVAIVVIDSGPGVDPKFADKIFEKFFRVPNQNAGGVGLGLAIARRIVEAHGGSIACQPNPTGGSQFRIRLPTTTLPSGHA